MTLVVGSPSDPLRFQFVFQADRSLFPLFLAAMFVSSLDFLAYDAHLCSLLGLTSHRSRRNPPLRRLSSPRWYSMPPSLAQKSLLSPYYVDISKQSMNRAPFTQSQSTFAFTTRYRVADAPHPHPQRTRQAFRDWFVDLAHQAFEGRPSRYPTR